MQGCFSCSPHARKHPLSLSTRSVSQSRTLVVLSDLPIVAIRKQNREQKLFPHEKQGQREKESPGCAGYGSPQPAVPILHQKKGISQPAEQSFPRAAGYLASESEIISELPACLSFLIHRHRSSDGNSKAVMEQFGNALL